MSDNPHMQDTQNTPNTPNTSKTAETSTRPKAKQKILTVSDTVSKELLEPSGGGPLISDIGLVLACGDLPPEYLTSLRHRYDAPLYYVLGNHDLRYRKSPPVGCRNIDRQLITLREGGEGSRLNGLRLLGFSGSRWYNGNINQYTEKQMSRFINRLRFTLWHRRGVDLVITHAPPRFIHDEEDPCHKGFRVFRRFIDKYQPRFFIHGHIHTLFENDAQRITRINSTAVINSYGYHVLEI